MKTIYLVRHAKSSWATTGIADHARQLSERGEKDLERMFARLSKNSANLPTMITTSDAVRAKTTALRLAENIGVAGKNFVARHDLYLASSDRILAVARDLPENDDHAAIVGHNPGFTDAANRLAEDFQIDNLPTCGVVGLEFSVDSWSDVEYGGGALVYFDFPKNAKDPLKNSNRIS